MRYGLLVTGVAGVGKSRIAVAAGRILSSRGKVVAVVDTDDLAQFGPPPGVDQARGGRREFYDAMKCTNLAALWVTFRSAGAQFAVVAAGVDSVELRARYAASLEGCLVRCVRLVAPPGTIRARLVNRDHAVALDRHLSQLHDQETVLDAAAVEDFQVVNDRSDAEVARDVISRWLVAPG